MSDKDKNTQQKTVFRNLKLFEQIRIGDTIITIDSNPKSHVRLRIRTSAEVEITPIKQEEAAA